MRVEIPSEQRAMVALAIAGPSNRGKLLSSAVRIARRTGRQLYVCWWPQMYWCSYEGQHSGPWHEMPYQLTQYHDLGFAKEIDGAEAYRYGWLRKIAEAKTDAEKEAVARWDDNVIHDEEREERVIVVSGWRYLRFPSEPPLDFLGCNGNPWNEKAANIIGDILREGGHFVKPVGTEKPEPFATIGVQVRVEHDYCHKIPLENFARAAVEKMRTIPEASRVRGNSFLVCSDNMEAEQRVCDLIKQLDGSASVDRRYRVGDLWERMKKGEGLRDLLSLASCGYLVGSKGSSFSELAYALSGRVSSEPMVWVDVNGWSCEKV